MPVGEVSVLGSALTFAITQIAQKALSMRLRPLTLGALGAFGGGLFSLFLVLILGKMEKLTGADLGYLFLGITGGILNIGMGEPLFLVFLRMVDVSKAQPMVMGLMTIFSVMSGIFILQESPTSTAIAGILVIIGATYLLSFSQRKMSDPKQAVWLGLRGILLLSVVCTFWTTGITIQGVALRRIDPVVLNMCRLLAASMFLTTMATLGLNEMLVPTQKRGRVQILRQIAGRYVAARPWEGLGAWRRRFWEFSTHPLEAVAHRPGAEVGGLANPTSGTGPAVTFGSTGASPEKRFSWSMAAAVGNGGISLGVGSLLMLIGVHKAGLAVTSILGTTQLVWLAIFSTFILKEKLNRRSLAGILLMFVGVVLIVI